MGSVVGPGPTSEVVGNSDRRGKLGPTWEIRTVVRNLDERGETWVVVTDLGPGENLDRPTWETWAVVKDPDPRPKTRTKRDAEIEAPLLTVVEIEH